MNGNSETRPRPGRTADAAPWEPVRYADGVLRVIDQTRLPSDECWIELRSAEDVAEAIRSLRVRGAPLIGICGAYGIAVALRSSGVDGLSAAEDLIGGARPTAVNLAWAVRRVAARARDADARGEDAVCAAEAEAQAIHRREVDACERMARAGAELVPPGARVLTVCNTGALATGGIGTALGVIATAHAEGRVAHVWVPETRPLLQGARLTAWELARGAIPYAVVADGAVGSLLSRGQVDVVFVGADRIAANGDVANKVGTYPMAVLARRHGVPFHVVAPSSTVDADTPDGGLIEIEERAGVEVAEWGGVRTVPEGSAVHNPAFDVTPAELVSSVVTEIGVHRPPYAFDTSTFVSLPSANA